ncbi:hypothetical protein CRPA25_31990 [Pseudomonas aeruginosa]
MAGGSPPLPGALHAHLGVLAEPGRALSEKWIKRQAHTSVKDLESSIEHYLATYNQNPRPFRWHKGADEILASVRRAASVLSKKL